VARKGAVNLNSTGHEMTAARRASAPPAPTGEWVQDTRPAAAAPREASVARAPYTLPADVAADVRRAFVGTAYMREKMVVTLTRAAEAYDRHRYDEALRLGRIVADAVPGVGSVRELTGLAAYRAERWAMSRIHLLAHFDLTQNPEHLPLVMDCDRANRRFRAVEKVFATLTQHEPTPDVLAEGRIVMAACWAEQGQLTEAIDLLVRSGATKVLRNPGYRHVRLWYALADLYDRAGDVTSARELFGRVAAADPDAYDARQRFADLGSGAPRKNRRRRVTPTSKKKVD